MQHNFESGAHLKIMDISQCYEDYTHYVHRKPIAPLREVLFMKTCCRESNLTTETGESAALSLKGIDNINRPRRMSALMSWALESAYVPKSDRVAWRLEGIPA